MQIGNFVMKSSEVLVCSEEIISLKQESILQLKSMAAASPKQRARICAHKDNSSVIQEMIIFINKSSYIRPHRHQDKCESFHLIDGGADIVVFKDDGEIEKVIPFSSRGAFYYRLDTPRFHTIVVRTESIVFHEVTNGPFVANATEFAAFSPEEDDEDGVNQYCHALNMRIHNWLSENS